MTNTTIDNIFLNQMMEEGLEALTLLEENDDDFLATIWLEKYSEIIDENTGGDLDGLFKGIFNCPSNRRK